LSRRTGRDTIPEIREQSTPHPIDVACGKVHEANQRAAVHCGRTIGGRCARHSQEHNTQGASKGEVLRQTSATFVHLPPPDTKRWTARRKASVVAAVLSSIITIEEVCQRYGLSVDEFRSWHNAMQRHGLQGLRITKLQNYHYSRPK